MQVIVPLVTDMLLKYRRMKFMSLFIFQVILMVLYFWFVKYGSVKEFDVQGTLSYLLYFLRKEEKLFGFHIEDI